MAFSEFANLVCLKNPYHNQPPLPRDTFRCLRLNIPLNSDIFQQADSLTKTLTPALNKGGANTSISRSLKNVEADNLAGLIAEFACRELFLSRYGDILTPADNSNGVNQVDIKLKNGKTVEVRASGVRNGIEFAVFKLDKAGKSYIDIIGPYVNHYKHTETTKDYYLRPIFPFCVQDIFKVMEKRKRIPLYLVGGATSEMIWDPAISTTKSMLPSSPTPHLEETLYRVLPVIQALDISEFLEHLEKETGLVSISNSGGSL